MVAVTILILNEEREMETFKLHTRRERKRYNNVDLQMDEFSFLNRRIFSIMHAGDIPFIKGITHPYLHSSPLLLLCLVLHVPQYKECVKPELEYYVLKNRRDIQYIFIHTHVHPSIYV